MICTDVVIRDNIDPRSEIRVVQVLREEVEKVDTDTSDLRCSIEVQ